MKIYKLIKTYPSIPKTVKEGDSVQFNRGMGLYSKDSTLDTFHIDEVEKNPEFWEEQYNTLLVYDNIGKCYYRRSSLDTILWRCMGQYNQGKPIDTIQYTIVFDTKGYRFKAIPPVIITEDEVQVYAGDKFWWVNLSSTHPIWEHTCKEKTKNQKKYKAFSTKELAIEYYIMNVKRLSMQDVYDLNNKAWTRGGSNPTKAFDTDLLNLVKSKLTEDEKQFLL